MTETEHHSPELPPDPSGIEEPHDILAAEEFGIGTRDERFPADPSGIQEPHDILAAEEFAMPAPDARTDPAGAVARAADPRALLPLLLLAAVLLIALRRRR